MLSEDFDKQPQKNAYTGAYMFSIFPYWEMKAVVLIKLYPDFEFT
jgi:hypothetical protein